MASVADLTDEESNSDDDHSVASLGEGKDEETLSAAGNPDVQQLDIEQTGRYILLSVTLLSHRYSSLSTIHTILLKRLLI